MSRSGLGRAKWTRIIREQQASGLSVVAFCAGRGTAESSFYPWRRKLGRCVGVAGANRSHDVKYDIDDLDRVIQADEGTFGDHEHPHNIFDFTLSRSRDGPAQFLKGYKGTLAADAYGGYDGIVVGNDIVRAGCWAHARRKFVDAEATHPAIAAEAVGIIKKLYAIEERGKGLDVRARMALRQGESVPILAALKDKLFAWREQLLPKHPMAQAIGYALNQWNELTVFAGDGAGDVRIDNSASEREITPTTSWGTATASCRTPTATGRRRLRVRFHPPPGVRRMMARSSATFHVVEAHLDQGPVDA
jgi:hypothetical protein